MNEELRTLLQNIRQSLEHIAHMQYVSLPDNMSHKTDKELEAIRDSIQKFLDNPERHE
jgi:hypothetical protein